MSAAQVFLEHQPLLQRIAVSMVDCIKDAEDLVQDTFEKWLKIDHEKVRNAKAYLIGILKNKCVDFLNSFRKTKEIQFGAPLELFKNKYEEIDIRLFDFETDVRAGITELLQKISLPEFSILLLKEGFEFDYPELSTIFGKKLEHCRQLLSRAKKKRSGLPSPFSLSADRSKEVASEVLKVYQQGNIQALVAFLQREVNG